MKQIVIAALILAGCSDGVEDNDVAYMRGFTTGYALGVEIAGGGDPVGCAEKAMEQEQHASEEVRRMIVGAIKSGANQYWNRKTNE